ncbi:MAG: hypothetical protein WEB59_10960 [Thermoanaerobaculia bacterium]
MSAGFVWLAAFLLLPLAGWPLLAHPAFGWLPFVSRAALSGACGAVLVSFAMTAGVLSGIPWNVPALTAAGALLAFALRVLVPKEPGGPVLRERLGAAGAAAHGLALLAVLAALAAARSGAASSPDLLFFWGPKAQQFALARTFDEAFMRNEVHGYMHAYYPPLVTNLGAFASIAAGRFVWTAAVLTFPLLLAALALGLPGVLRASLPRTAAAATSALVVAAIGLIGMEADIGGDGEMPLLVFETLALALLLSPAAGRGATLLLAGLLLAGASSTKVEALPFTLAAAFLFAILRREPGRSTAAKTLALLLAPSVLALSAWFAFGARRGFFRGYAEYGRFLDLHPDHLPTVLDAIARALAGTDYGLPWLVPLACVFVAARRLTRISLLPLGVAATLTGFLIFAYMHSAEDPSQWISWSAARVFSPVAMLLALSSVTPAGGAERETPKEPASPA